MIDLRPRRPWESDEAAQFRDMVRRFLLAEAVPRDAAWRAQKFVDRNFWLQAGALGLLCPGIPDAFGGGGGDFALDAIVSEELSYAGITSFQQLIHGGIVAPYILHYGTEDQRQRWLPKMASGEMIGAIAMTEPGGGSDLQAVRTSARREGESYVLNGAKTFITNGIVADLVIVAARTGPEPGARGLSLIVVETAGLAGFRRGRNLNKIGMHGSDTAELFFDEVRVPAENRLGAADGQGFVQMMQQLPQERLGVAVGAQAMMERAIEITVDHARTRSTFGKVLMELQNTRFTLADCLARAQVSRAFVDRCIEGHLAGRLTAADASMAKMWTTDRQCEVIDDCLQLHGGYGFMEEYPIARMYADVRVQRIYGGANEIMKEIIARSLG
ncbi:acyl-CoA dehydrogenase family protein [Frigidibacter mobilis]|uniref:Acyl-[acyl-carrier-protein] dehydrogenase MbtN n=1 Tax=Frigidibacter mobilis TaxID=1335048 RepID=A0A165SIY8_9RHOB|nr:acyl-CoA dehydrogenase family protein [Frigidibacter mobilis]AMY68519.1 acyl-CoA dehydrogenase [Frigidibacter mobilis]